MLAGTNYKRMSSRDERRERHNTAIGALLNTEARLLEFGTRHRTGVLLAGFSAWMALVYPERGYLRDAD